MDAFFRASTPARTNAHRKISDLRYFVELASVNKTNTNMVEQVFQFVEDIQRQSQLFLYCNQFAITTETVAEQQCGDNKNVLNHGLASQHDSQQLDEILMRLFEKIEPIDIFVEHQVVNSIKKKGLNLKGLQVFWFVLFVTINIGVFSWKFLFYLKYRQLWMQSTNNGIAFARGFAQLVLLNASLLLTPVSRFYKKIAFGRFRLLKMIPFNTSADIHILFGITIYIFGLCHSGSHIYILLNLRKLNYEDRYKLLGENVDKSFGGKNLEFQRYVLTIPGMTGLIMVFTLTVMVFFSSPWFRQHYHDIFRFTHVCLFPVFYTCLLMHGACSWTELPQAHYWLVPPLIVYIWERKNRFIWKRVTTIKELQLSYKNDKDVSLISMTLIKPLYIRNYSPGMYIYMNIPEISYLQWHPFSLVFCPLETSIKVLIRPVGGWTKNLSNLIESKFLGHFVEPAIKKFQGELKVNSDQYSDLGSIKICLDGPIHCISQYIYQYRSVLLIGCGIGAAPLMSVFLNCFDRNEQENNRVVVHFHWVSRFSSDFMQFSSDLNDRIESMYNRRAELNMRFQIHTYTTALRNASPKQLLAIRLYQMLCETVERKDVISGLIIDKSIAPTHIGRPNWNSIVKNMKNSVSVECLNEHEQVGVFLCAPKNVEEKVKLECKLQSSSSMKFVCHTEEF